jgi:hypothetical protein
MATFFITCARTPVALTLMKILKQYHHTVYALDSLPKQSCIGAASPYHDGYYQYPAPTTEFEAFKHTIQNLTNVLKPDLVVPVSEETFWMAMVPNIPLFASPLETLNVLHNKSTFTTLSQSIGYGPKEAYTFENEHQLAAFLSTSDSHKYVFKPSYSRFGHQALIQPSKIEVLKNTHYPLLAQTFLPGTEVCVYNIAYQGKQLACMPYLPKYKYKEGASIYFEPLYNPEIKHACQQIIEATHFTGQISFDLILQDNHPTFIECNPRATSGLHLLAQQPHHLKDCIEYALSQNSTNEIPLSCKEQCTQDLFDYQARALGVAMLLTHPSIALSTPIVDVLQEDGVPRTTQLKIMTKLMKDALLRGVPIEEASTHDIIWNGPSSSY